MKRSKAVTLKLTAVAAALALANCGREPQPDDTAFSSVQECAEKSGDWQTCRDSWSAAHDSHVAAAPRFHSFDECEREYGAGRCELAKSGSSDIIIPLMAGYLLGRTLGGGSVTSTPLMSSRRDDDQQQQNYTGGGGRGFAYNPAPRVVTTSSNSAFAAPRGSGGGGIGESARASAASARGGFGASAGPASAASS